MKSCMCDASRSTSTIQSNQNISSICGCDVRIPGTCIMHIIHTYVTSKYPFTYCKSDILQSVC